MQLTGNILLDTNAVVALLNNSSGIDAVFEPGIQAFLPVPTLGELFFGVYASARKKSNIHCVERLIALLPILHIDSETARIYGTVRAQLKRAGTPIPENDIWNASIALQHKIPILTKDKHFVFIQGLKTQTW